MRFAIWRHPARKHISRAYINGLACLSGGAKAYLQPQGGGVALVVNPAEAYEAVCQALIEAGIIREAGDFAALPFTQFEQLAAQPADGGATRKSPAPARSMPGNRLPEAEALDLTTIPVPDPVTLCIDHREPEALFAAFEGLPNVRVERVELPVGDIVINDRYVIERKCCTETTGRTDFEASVVDDSRRLFFQSEKMRLEDGIIPIVLLEGEPHEFSRGMRVQAVDGMVSFLVTIQKLNVITTYSLHHTAYMLLKLAVHDRSGLGYEVALRGKKPRQQSDQLAFVLEGLPGVSANLARRLADQFGSLAALVRASEAELRAVPGLGPKRIEQIRAVLHGEAR